MTTHRTNLEVIAPSVEEAIEKGLAELGLSQDEVEVEILDEGTKGLFGLGSRQSRILLTVKSTPETEVGAAQEEIPQPKAEPAIEASVPAEETLSPKMTMISF